jgi:hypothetical protein
VFVPGEFFFQTNTPAYFVRTPMMKKKKLKLRRQDAITNGENITETVLSPGTASGVQVSKLWNFFSFSKIFRVHRLGDFSQIRLLIVGSLKKYPKNGNTLGYKFITFSPK